jgi:predicted transcriptional regulator
MGTMESESESPDLSRTDIARMSADVVSAYLANNAMPPTGVPELIRTVHDALSGLEHAQGASAPAPAERQKPAVPISKSIQDDYIVCLEDGARLKMLKRYLRSRYDMSPEEYRRKWGLPPDYPMVAPAYAQRRSDFARQIGLGKGVRRKRAAK